MRLLNRISDTHAYGGRSAMTLASIIRDWSMGVWYDGGVASNNIGAKAGITLLTHSLTHSLTYSLTYSLTHLLTYSLTYSLTLTHLLTYSLTY